jgi:hypothetical protein
MRAEGLTFPCQEEILNARHIVVDGLLVLLLLIKLAGHIHKPDPFLRKKVNDGPKFINTGYCHKINIF